MGTGTKIHLSKLETELVNNKDWILTKHTVIGKVYQLFGSMNEIYRQVLEEEKFTLPGLYQGAGGKISKGENYEGLPYVMLDYPAMFSRENIFAVRTMFWWGNFFSITLHVSGTHMKLPEDYKELFAYLGEQDFYVCVNENEWQHNFEVHNYIAARETDLHAIKQIFTRNFFKISKNLGLDRWDEAPAFLERSFREIIGFLKFSFPAGEKAPLPGFPKAGSDL